MIEQQNNQKKSGFSKDKLKKEVVGLLWAVFIAFLFRTFLYQPFNVPTGSMIPTIVIGDYLLVNKFCYGYSHQSLPFGLKFFSGRVFKKSPVRGDVVVFFNPKDDNRDYVKRLIGMPGDRIQMIKGVLHINGNPVALKEVSKKSTVDDRRGAVVVTEYTETLPGGYEHPIWKMDQFGESWLDNTEEFLVPEGHYFMMGDNRDNSQDSRVQERVGFIPEDNIIGRADMFFFSTEAKWYEFWKWPFETKFSRIAKIIK